MSKLQDMKNIGKVLAVKLELAHIKSSEELISIGAKEAFIRVKSIYPDACINHLYAIEGAIQNIRWHYLNDDTKNDLKDFYDGL